MSDEEHKSNPEVNAVVERYGRRGGSARKEGPSAKKQQGSGFWSRVVDWVAPPTEDGIDPITGEPVPASEGDAHGAAPDSAAPGPAAPAGASPLQPAAVHGQRPALAVDDLGPARRPALTGPVRSAPPPAPQLPPPSPSAPLRQAPTAGRVALELLMPDGERLLIVGHREPDKTPGLVTVRLEPAPRNDAAVIDALSQLAADGALPGSSMSARADEPPRAPPPPPRAAPLPPPSATSEAELRRRAPTEQVHAADDDDDEDLDDDWVEPTVPGKPSDLRRAAEAEEQHSAAETLDGGLETAAAAATAAPALEPLRGAADDVAGETTVPDGRAPGLQAQEAGDARSPVVAGARRSLTGPAPAVQPDGLSSVDTDKDAVPVAPPPRRRRGKVVRGGAAAQPDDDDRGRPATERRPTGATPTSEPGNTGPQAQAQAQARREAAQQPPDDDGLRSVPTVRAGSSARPAAQPRGGAAEAARARAAANRAAASASQTSAGPDAASAATVSSATMSAVSGSTEVEISREPAMEPAAVSAAGAFSPDAHEIALPPPQAPAALRDSMPPVQLKPLLPDFPEDNSPTNPRGRPAGAPPLAVPAGAPPPGAPTGAPPSAPPSVAPGTPAGAPPAAPPAVPAGTPHGAPPSAPPSAQQDPDAAFDSAVTPAHGSMMPEAPPDRGFRPVVKAAPIVGIDFGTSYSSVAVLRAGLEVIPDENGETLTPSVVSFPEPGRVIVGSEARRRMGGEAQWTIASPKRLLGRAYKDPQVSSLLGPLALRTFAGTDKLIRFDAHGEIYSVTDICAMILGKMRERACRHLGVDVTKAVFAVPVAFGSLHRSALELAAKQAGLQGVAMLTEPSAALLAHGFRGRKGLAAVYDFGGGTFDFCVVDISETAFSVVCAGGDPWLGGDDFDNAMAEALADRFWKDTGVDLRTRAVEWQRVLFACEEAKRRLSHKGSAHIRVDDLIQTSGGPRGMSYKMSRKEFVQLIEPLVKRSLGVVERVMTQANIRPRDVDTVVMTGGISMVPHVRDRVTQLFGRKPVVGDADVAVARGTALRAAELGGEAMGGTSMGGRTLREVSGRTIGVGSEGGQVITLFERDTPLPAESSQTFYTHRDGQTEMLITLYEAAKSRVDERQVLGQLRYKGLRPAPAGQSFVEFTFILDEDGLLHVTALVEGKVYDKTIRLS